MRTATVVCGLLMASSAALASPVLESLVCGARSTGDPDAITSRMSAAEFDALVSLREDSFGMDARYVSAIDRIRSHAMKSRFHDGYDLVILDYCDDEAYAANYGETNARRRATLEQCPCSADDIANCDPKTFKYLIAVRDTNLQFNSDILSKLRQLERSEGVDCKFLFGGRKLKEAQEHAIDQADKGIPPEYNLRLPLDPELQKAVEMTAAAPSSDPAFEADVLIKLSGTENDQRCESMYREPCTTNEQKRTAAFFETYAEKIHEDRVAETFDDIAPTVDPNQG